MASTNKRMVPLRVEAAACEVRAGLPVLLLTVDGVAAEVSNISLGWLQWGLVQMEGGPPHSAVLIRPKRKTQTICGATDNPVIVELARRLALDWREGRRSAGPREIPTAKAASAACWEINYKADTIRRKERQ